LYQKASQKPYKEAAGYVHLNFIDFEEVDEWF